MITGTVNADREPVVRIRVRDRNGRNHEFAAIVDTGFTGSLTLPLNVITALGLPWKELSEATLADAVDRDIERPQVQGAGAGQSQQGRLGGRVGVPPGRADQAHDRRDVDHPAPAPLLHARRQGAGQGHATGQVEFH